MMRLPSHGLRFGLPPKLHGHEIVQLQLSATVAVTCQFGAAARGGAVRAAENNTAATISVRIAQGSMLRPRKARGFSGSWHGVARSPARSAPPRARRPRGDRLSPALSPNTA